MDIFSSEQQAELVNRLIDLTRAGRLHWVADGRFLFSGSGRQFSYSLESRDHDDLHPFDLGIRNIDEDIVAVFSSDTEREEFNRGIQQLYILAKRQALRLDELAVDVFKDLDAL